MASEDELNEWRERFREVVQPGRTLDDAKSKLENAARKLGSAHKQLEIDDTDMALIAAEAAMVSAADAILARDGYRIRGKTSSHEARFAYPGLPHEFSEEQRRINAARESRNIALYDRPDTVSRAFAQDVVAAAERLVASARRLIGP